MRTSFTALVMVVITMQLLVQQAEAGVTIVLGGEDGPGWTNKANIDYDKYMSSFKVKVGDTLVFYNYDTTDHTIVTVDKAGYDSCGESGTKLAIVNISPSLKGWSYTYLGSGDDYFICDIPGHCKQGMKVHVQVLNEDGSVNTTSSYSAAPGLNSWTSIQLMQVVLVSIFSVMAAAAASM